jgi:hypothetical protein
MASTAFLAGGREFIIFLDDRALHRLIGTGFLSPASASAETFLGKYEPLLREMAASLDTFATCMAAACRRQVDELNLGHADFANLFCDRATRLAALDAFMAAARLEAASFDDPRPVGEVSKA